MITTVTIVEWWTALLSHFSRPSSVVRSSLITPTRQSILALCSRSIPSFFCYQTCEHDILTGTNWHEKSMEKGMGMKRPTLALYDDGRPARCPSVLASPLIPIANTHSSAGSIRVSKWKNPQGGQVHCTHAATACVCQSVGPSVCLSVSLLYWLKTKVP